MFGDVVDGEMSLNELAEIVRFEWLKTAKIRHEIELDEFVIMPNHFHAIICIVYDQCRGDRPVALITTGPRSKSIGFPLFSDESKTFPSRNFPV